MNPEDLPLAGLVWRQIWQVTVLALAVGVIVRLGCRRRPHLAYLLWLLVILKSLTPPIWRSPAGAFGWIETRLLDALARPAREGALGVAREGVPSANLLITRDGIVQSPLDEESIAAAAGTPVASNAAGSSLESILSLEALLASAWALGAIAFGALVLARWRGSLRALRASAGPANAEVAALAADLSRAMGLRRRATVLVTQLPVGPLVAGFLRPTVVLPATVLEAASAEDLRAILAHEIVHIRRRDTIAGAVQVIARVVWWFHPLIAWASREATRERERSCDEEVLARLHLRPFLYARSLLGVLELKARLRGSPALPGIRPYEITKRRLEDIMDRARRPHCRTPRAYWVPLLLVGAFTLPAAQLSPPPNAPAPTGLLAGDSASGPGKDIPLRKGDGAAEKPLTPECEKLFREIQELDRVIPTIFAGLTRPAEDILRDIETLIERGQRFIANCPDTAPASGVKASVARMLLAKSARHRQALGEGGLKGANLKEKHVLYLAEALKLGEAAVREAPLGSLTRAKALHVVIDLRNELAKEDSSRRAEHLEHLRTTAEVLLEEFPDWKGRPQVQITVASSFHAERRYDDAVKYLDDVIKAHPNDPELVHYNDLLFDALTGVGDLERMEDLMEIIGEEYPVMIEKGAVKQLEEQYELWLCLSDFWRGFVRMALGDNKGARERLNEHAEKSERTLKAKEEEGGSIANNACNITLQFRTLALLDFLDNFAGKAPKVDFDLLWATEEKVTLKEKKGKVVAALFRKPGDRRSETFLKELDALSKKLEKEGLAALTVGFLSGTPDDAAREKSLQAMRGDLRELGVNLPAGYDPDPRARPIFRAMRATVGSASFVAFNRKGEIAWFLADPRDMDRRILERVLRRLLAQ
ncbi:MAG TPA: M56 family metallopeptidase [Planctomycetota bacterium]|nr:M56 family metallopeptidase [Planctomycetota bacterium]